MLNKIFIMGRLTRDRLAYRGGDPMKTWTTEEIDVLIQNYNVVSNETLALMSFGSHTTFHHLGKRHSEETKQKIREQRAKVC